LLKLLLPVLMLASSTILFGNPSAGLGSCPAATLSTYASDFPKGCAIGILDYSNFTYHSVSNAPLAGDIFLTPSSQGFGFTQTNGKPFTAALGQIVQFEVDYTIFIDPAPVIGGADDSLDPPTGNVTASEFFCNDLRYVYSGSCQNGSPYKLSVGTPSTGLPYSASISFGNSAKQFQTVGILFTLDGTDGVSSFDGLDTDTQLVITPEPVSAMLTGLFLVAGGCGFRKQRRS
jgi:hypothetical protein